ncbi:esterase family protein [Gordonia sputi]|uniref:alpha/beta hydrolase n=1 Tax=Gordonia sputi TaxID=36823 RepID=UPI00204449E7|nr:alpha/beta hydrolase family protein [Gordonia sputi]MCM3896169.1 esterase family protein [Gordonia sputi]
MLRPLEASRRCRRGASIVATSLAVVLATVAAVFTGTAVAAPALAAVVRIDRVDDQLSIVYVYSPSMSKVIPNQVLRPRGEGSAPVFYLLNGRSGGVEGDSWLKQTDHRSFFAGKNVTVVSPLGGPYAWYADWQRPDPALGVNKWETYLLRELPGAIVGPLRANGRNAIAGLSLSGGPALDIAGRGGSLYRAAASYSGCPAISAPPATAGVFATTSIGGGNALNMFGPPGSPAWIDHDPSRNPARLRGKAIYLGAASGLPGRTDGAPLGAPSLLAGPAEVEMGTHWCTDQMAAALNGAGIPHTYRVFDQGAHTWSLFATEMRDSWRVIGPALGA